MSKLIDDLQGRYIGVDDNPEYDQEVANVAPDKLKTCLICGKSFIKNRRAVYCNRQHYTTCINCGKRLDITDNYFRAGFVPKTCCKTCADAVGAQVLKENCLAKYGVTNPMYVQEFADKAFLNANPHLTIADRKAVETRICEVCGKEFIRPLTDPKKCCSVACASKLREQHISEKTRICKLCGKPFAPKYGKSLYCEGPHYRNCIICGKSFLLKDCQSTTQTCSEDCKNQLLHLSNPKKLEDKPLESKDTSPKQIQKVCVLCGKSFITTKISQRVCPDVHYRNCEVCGKSFIIKRPSSSQRCCSKECTVQKREATTKDRYGFAHALQSPDLLKKAQLTTFEHYGVKHAMQSEVIAKKVEQTFLDKYGVPTPFLMDGFNEKAVKTNLQRYGKEHLVPTAISKTNKVIANVIETKTGYSCELDKIKLGNYSYDIHILDTNILLEIDPTYTHNVLGNHWHNSGVPSAYHQTKTKTATDNGYRCIHIFDWDDLDKVIQLVAPKKALYARQCILKSVSSKAAAVFEKANHLQNNCRGQAVRLGLYYDGELVQLMTFGKPRYNKKCSWELLRLCSRSDLRIVGGAEKLFSYFVTSYDPDSIVSYCDLAKFTGEVYLKLGFNLSYVTKPNKIWSKRKEMITNNLLNARGYDQLFGTSYGKGTSNEQLMLEHGWRPVYDCGQAVYVWGTPKT